MMSEGIGAIDGPDIYVSPAFLMREAKWLWPRAWQPACHVSEVAEVGNYLTYDVLGDSIVIVRDQGGVLRGFHNACRHRGRRLTDGCGSAARLVCPFHAWKYNLDGSIHQVLDRHDWDGALTDAELSLQPVKLDTWAGWVFINMDPHAEPLSAFLGEVPTFLDPFEFENHRFKWYRTFEVGCNWKVALESFSESYHTAGTHGQLQRWADDLTSCRTFGRHGQFGGWPARPLGSGSPRTGKPAFNDIRPGIIAYYDMMNHTLDGIRTSRDVEASRRLMTEVEEGAPPEVVMARLWDILREAAMATGAGWPRITREEVGQAGLSWHIFPNMVVIPSTTASLWYRARPVAGDPDKCVFDVWSMQRYAPGAEPPLKREFYTDWRDCKGLGLILNQDFSNMEHVQRGMHSRSFDRVRFNPVQEAVIINHHRALKAFIEDGEATERGWIPSVAAE